MIFEMKEEDRDFKEDKFSSGSFSCFKELKTFENPMTIEKIHHVIATDGPPLPHTTEGDEYVAWETFKEKDALTTTYILSSIDKNLQSSCDDLESAKDVMEHLEQNFGNQDCLARQQISSAQFSAKMHDSTTIQDHMMKLTKLFSGLENNGTIFELDFKIEIIFASLPDAYSSFIMNFHMNKVVVNNVSELTNMLIEVESMLKKNKVVYLITEKSSQSSKNKKKKRTKKSKKGKSTGVKEGGVQKKKAKAVKGKCFHCGKTGH
ncbi:uncharacterized protein LOC122652015 [Telopea speciosissima]|uniref:uncharacterized protein LOC122652015 n=1 Tax=Telopea speciosissima TaxID=54955 RepID=UPI001CC67573|nr:uncharacterized protein LOC122652015 [Telopea speciosissima]